MSAEERLRELDITLPPAPTPVANYVTSLPIGDLLLVSGHGPAPAEGVKTRGKVGSELTTEEAYRTARQTGLGILATVQRTLGSLDRVERVVKVLGLVNATPDFEEHPQVINGCSDLFVEVFGPDRGKASRSALGAGSLPGQIPTEIEAMFLIKTGD